VTVFHAAEVSGASFFICVAGGKLPHPSRYLPYDAIYPEEVMVVGSPGSVSYSDTTPVERLRPFASLAFLASLHDFNIAHDRCVTTASSTRTPS